MSSCNKLTLSSLSQNHTHPKYQKEAQSEDKAEKCQTPKKPFQRTRRMLYIFWSLGKTCLAHEHQNSNNQDFKTRYFHFYVISPRKLTQMPCLNLPPGHIMNSQLVLLCNLPFLMIDHQLCHYFSGIFITPSLCNLTPLFRVFIHSCGHLYMMKEIQMFREIGSVFRGTWH